jgi:hypothetical protein
LAFLLSKKGPPIQGIELALMSGGCDDRFQDFDSIPELPIFNLESVELSLILLVGIIDLIDGISKYPV